MSAFNPFCKSRKLMREGGVGYTDGGTVVLPKTELTILPEVGVGIEKRLNIVVGKSYTATLFIDGEEYHSTGVCFEEEETKVPFIISMGGTSFILICTLVPEDYVDEFGCNTAFIIENLAKPLTVTIQISTTETIHTIDPKYISGVTLPIVELEPVTGGGYPAPLSDANCAALNALGGMPFVAVLKEESEVIAALVCSFFEGLYLCNGGTLRVIISPSDEQGEQWTFWVRDTADDS